MTDSKDSNVSNIKDDWMVRKCSVYDEEYSDCTSIKARFNQLFIYGKTLNCDKWKRDSVNCYKWIERNDTIAANELIESEKQRRKERLLAQHKNNVWTKRSSPPADWNAPLPEHLQKAYEKTYLQVKSMELKGEIPPSFDPNIGFCTIL